MFPEKPSFAKAEIEEGFREKHHETHKIHVYKGLHDVLARNQQRLFQKGVPVRRKKIQENDPS